jgi:hypothetical protein
MGDGSRQWLDGLVVVEDNTGDPFPWPRGGARAPRPSSAAVRRTRIGDRDGWICGICRWPVDRDRSAWRKLNRVEHQRDPLSAEVDHITPKDRGGSDADDNLQIAHAACNRHKHYDEQLAPEGARAYLVQRRLEDVREWEGGDQSRRWRYLQEHLLPATPARRVAEISGQGLTVIDAVFGIPAQ